MSHHVDCYRPGEKVLPGQGGGEAVQTVVPGAAVGGGGVGGEDMGGKGVGGKQGIFWEAL